MSGLPVRLTNQFGDNLNLNDLKILTKICQSAEIWTDMVLFITEVIRLRCATKQEISIEERNLLSIAYKNVVSSSRGSLRTLNNDNFANNELVKSYKSVIGVELKKQCINLLNLLESQVMPLIINEKSERSVFYRKMLGDYYRYLAEFMPDEKYKQQTQKHYIEAMEICKGILKATDPTRLGLALNLSVCYYEILNQHKKATELAKEAFDAAIEALDNLNDESYKDTTLIMQLLRDNLTLWTSTDSDE